MPRYGNNLHKTMEASGSGYITEVRGALRGTVICKNCKAFVEDHQRNKKRGRIRHDTTSQRLFIDPLSNQLNQILKKHTTRKTIIRVAKKQRNNYM